MDTARQHAVVTVLGTASQRCVFQASLPHGFLLQAEAIASAAALHSEMDQLRQQLASEVAALQAALAEQREQAAAAEEERAAERAAAQERSGHMQSRVRRPGAGLSALVGAAGAL